MAREELPQSATSQRNQEGTTVSEQELEAYVRFRDETRHLSLEHLSTDDPVRTAIEELRAAQGDRAQKTIVERGIGTRDAECESPGTYWIPADMGGPEERR